MGCMSISKASRTAVVTLCAVTWWPVYPGIDVTAAALQEQRPLDCGIVLQGFKRAIPRIIGADGHPLHSDVGKHRMASCQEHHA